MSVGRRPSSHFGLSLYEALGVARGASPEEIQRAYRHQMRLFHPRRHHHDPEAAERYHQARRAYSVLGHPERRRIYDRYGHLGIEIAETAGERFVLPAYILSRRWGRLLIAFLFLITCCCFGCCCCCGCCCGCCGADFGAWEDDLEEEEVYTDEEEHQPQQQRHRESANQDDRHSPRRHVTYGPTTVVD